jgi:hypothetical protein
MQLAASPMANPVAKPHETLLRYHDGKWPLMKKNLLRHAGVSVREITGNEDLIAIAGNPRGGRTLEQVIGHRKFTVEGQEERLRLVS